MYRHAVVADENGRFELTVPYATDDSSPSDIRARGSYRIDVGSGDGLRPWVEIRLTEAQVSTGYVVELEPHSGAQ